MLDIHLIYLIHRVVNMGRMVKIMTASRPRSHDELQSVLVNQLTKLLPSAVKIGEVIPAEGQVDLLIELERGGQHRRIALEIKSRGHAQFVDQAIAQLRRHLGDGPDDVPMVGAEYMPSASRLLCKEAGVGYIDAYGNLYLEDGLLLVDRETTVTPPAEKRRLKSLFTPMASRAVRTAIGEGVDWSILELASAAKISVGMAAKVLNRLVDEGFAQKELKRYTLSEPSRLLDEWVNAYDPAQHDTHRYYAFYQDPRDLLGRLQALPGILRDEYCLTGPAGASLVLPWTTFKSFHILVDRKSLDALGGELNLRATDSGANVLLIVPNDEACFWGKQWISDVAVASDLQLYLDLKKYAARGSEHADALREQRLLYGGKPL